MTAANVQELQGSESNTSYLLVAITGFNLLP